MPCGTDVVEDVEEDVVVVVVVSPCATDVVGAVVVAVVLLSRCAIAKFVGSSLQNRKCALR